MALALSIVTPAGRVVETETDSVVAPGAEGEFGVLPEHESFLAPLRAGVVRYDAGSAGVAVSSGFAEVTGERVTILVQSALRPDQVDRDAAERARQHAEQALAQTTTETPAHEFERLRDQLDTARAQLEVS